LSDYGWEDQPGASPAPARATGALPRPAELFGRELEMAAVGSGLDSGPVVTITGVGGVGKTALAVAAAACSDRDQKYFADLNPLTDPSLVAATVELAVGIDEGRGEDPLPALVEGLRYQDALLVLDNCEHVLDAVQALVLRVTEHCPGVRILATSRQPLRIRGEKLVRLSGLPARGPAEEMFMKRAATARAGRPLSEEVRPAVVELCARLDGLPLAIELAAARMNMLGPADLLSRAATWPVTRPYGPCSTGATTSSTRPNRPCSAVSARLPAASTSTRPRSSAWDTASSRCMYRTS
jgi:hypothetical protein